MQTAELCPFLEGALCVRFSPVSFTKNLVRRNLVSLCLFASGCRLSETIILFYRFGTINTEKGLSLITDFIRQQSR